MAVVIRLTRYGKKKHPFYRIVAADKEFPRDGRYLEGLGTYDPKSPNQVGNIKKERFDYWVKTGAKPSPLVSQIVERTFKS